MRLKICVYSITTVNDRFDCEIQLSFLYGSCTVLYLAAFLQTCEYKFVVDVVWCCVYIRQAKTSQVTSE